MRRSLLKQCYGVFGRSIIAHEASWPGWFCLVLETADPASRCGSRETSQARCLVTLYPTPPARLAACLLQWRIRLTKQPDEKVLCSRRQERGWGREYRLEILLTLGTALSLTPSPHASRFTYQLMNVIMWQDRQSFLAPSQLVIHSGGRSLWVTGHLSDSLGPAMMDVKAVPLTRLASQSPRDLDLHIYFGLCVRDRGIVIFYLGVNQPIRDRKFIVCRWVTRISLNRYLKRINSIFR